MKYLDDKINENNKIEKQIENNYIMALLLIIEQTYAKNENITGLKLNGKLNLQNIEFLDEEGFPLMVNHIDVSAMAHIEDIKKFTLLFLDNKQQEEKDKEVLNIVENIFSDFEILDNKESRFELYKKYMHGKIPDYKQTIKEWKDGKFITEIIEHENIQYIKKLAEINLEENNKIKNIIDKEFRDSYHKFKINNNHLKMLKYLVDTQEIVDSNEILEGFLVRLKVERIGYNINSSSGLRYGVVANLDYPEFQYTEKTTKEDFIKFKNKNPGLLDKIKFFATGTIFVNNKTDEIYKNLVIENVSNIFDFIKNNDVFCKLLDFTDDNYHLYKTTYEREKISEQMKVSNPVQPKIRL